MKPEVEPIIQTCPGCKLIYGRRSDRAVCPGCREYIAYTTQPGDPVSDDMSNGVTHFDCRAPWNILYDKGLL